MADRSGPVTLPAVEQDRLVSAAFRQAAVGLAIVDAGGRIAFANDAARRIAGGNLESRTLAELTAMFERVEDETGCSIPSGAGPATRALGGETTVDQELRIVRPGGAGQTLSVSATPVRDETGAVIGAVAAFTDMTARQERVAALVRARREAEQANAAKARFLATASHDLRHPVQAALLFAELLADHVEAPAGRELVARLVETLTGMKTMLATILELSRIGTGAVRAQPTEFAIGDLLEAVAETYAARAKAAGLSFRVVPSRCMVITDYELLSRMLENLVENALKFTTRGGILIGCRRRGNELGVVVADTGRGIPSDKLDAVFEEFVSLDSRPQHRPGLGLGLAIVRSLEALLGHRVQVRSIPGQGTMFEVAVPVAGAVS